MLEQFLFSFNYDIPKCASKYYWDYDYKKNHDMRESICLNIVSLNNRS